MKRIFTLLCVFALSVLGVNAQTNLWSGEQEVGWSDGIQLAADNFTSANVGDKISVTVSSISSTVSWPQVRMANLNGWASIDGVADFALSGKIVPLDVTFDITESTLSVIQENGIVIVGEGFTATSVDLLSTSSLVGTSLWTGETVISGWGDSQQFAASTFESVVEGDLLRVYVKDVTSGAQIKLADMGNGWADLTGTAIVDLSDGATYIDFEITPEGLTALQAGGIAIQGKQFTLTGLSVMSAEEKVEDNYVSTTIWEGEQEFVEWGGSVIIGASAFADASVGDKIVVNVSAIGEKDSWPQIQILTDAAGGWLAFEGVPNYNLWDLTAPVAAEFTINGEMLSLLKETGLVVFGTAYTTTSVELLRKVTAGVESIPVQDAAVSTDDPNAPIYNLQGQRVTKATKGILIQNGKKFLNK